MEDVPQKMTHLQHLSQPAQKGASVVRIKIFFLHFSFPLLSKSGILFPWKMINILGFQFRFRNKHSTRLNPQCDNDKRRNLLDFYMSGRKCQVAYEEVWLSFYSILVGVSQISVLRPFLRILFIC